MLGHVLTVYTIFVLQYDPFAEHRPQKIAEREDEYKARRRQMIISPERLDPFADGKFCSFFLFIKSSPLPPPFHGSLFCTLPHDYQWFHTHSFAVQPFDHNAIDCFPDSMPSLWSILCGPATSCPVICSFQFMVYI